MDSVSFSEFTHEFTLNLSGALPADDDFTQSTWYVLFNPSRSSGIEGTGLTFSPTGNCGPNSGNHFFCVPASGATPDVSFTGTFTAAGGTKPLYQFELLAGIYSNRNLLGFRPGFSTKMEVNQSASPPIKRTTFDPDSVSAAFALQKLQLIGTKDHPQPMGQKQNQQNHHALSLYGIQWDETLPGGEFTRKDPTSNIIVNSSAQFILKSITVPGHLTYGSLYPLIGLEAGHNLNKPSQLDSVAVDLTRYNAILRGIGGANGIFARKSKDASIDVWSITGSYLVRIPAADEPLVKTIHQVTAVQLTTRARHWVEVDGSVSPWSFKYLGITAKYQFGELPPVFNFVDHSFSIGLTLKATQSNKGNAAGPPLNH